MSVFTNVHKHRHRNGDSEGCIVKCSLGDIFTVHTVTLQIGEYYIAYHKHKNTFGLINITNEKT